VDDIQCTEQEPTLFVDLTGMRAAVRLRSAAARPPARALPTGPALDLAPMRR
jgi:hypothetical protein